MPRSLRAASPPARNNGNKINWGHRFLHLERDLRAGVELERRLDPQTGDQLRHVRFSLVETGNLRSKPVGGGTQRIVREMSVSLGRRRGRVPQQSPDDL